MQTKNLIEINEFCIIHNVEISFISSLEETGLIKTTTNEDVKFFDTNQLQKLEKYIRFFYELDINLEGIETIEHLLEKIMIIREENIKLKNRLRLYEAE